MKKAALLLLAAILLILLTSTVVAQHGPGSWSLSAIGGGNYWLNDLSTQKFGGGFNLVVRNAVTKTFSLGLMAGYQDLKTEQTPPEGGNPYGYLKLRSFPAAAAGYYYFNNKGTFNPYGYVGVGALMYQRVTGTGLKYPNENYVVSLLVPLGVGFEAFTSKRVAFTADVGVRGISDWADLKKNKGFEMYLTAMAGFTFYLSSGADADDDNDGLTNAQEKEMGTDPNNPDTDGDGLKDGEESFKYHTNPLLVDTDADKVSDGDEVFRYHTDPAKSDTDGDGLFDGEEIFQYHTDPLRADTDGDGLRDGQEVLRYKTDPLLPDTDHDGLNDYEECITYFTDPLKADTDGDGLSDGDEIHKYKTNPLKADTDGGGMKDGEEVKKGKNPLDPKDDRDVTMGLERGKKLVLEGVTFQTGSATLTKESDPALRSALNALLAAPSVVVEVAGYTDNVGEPKANEWLSLRRARTVVDWLVRNGVPSWRLTAAGYGQQQPVALNDTPQGRAKNRRIEFHVR
jgi:outer membrane protein OmpA-like peptidoglycan-associated protein